MAADPQLAEEQQHLDRTFAAYDALLDALSVSRRNRQGDVFTEEVLERMRLERLRAYTGASGPLYFGRIDRPGDGRSTSGGTWSRTRAMVHAEPLPDVLADAEDLRPVPEAGAADAWAAGRR